MININDAKKLTSENMDDYEAEYFNSITTRFEQFLNDVSSKIEQNAKAGLNRIFLNGINGYDDISKIDRFDIIDYLKHEGYTVKHTLTNDVRVSW